MNAAVKRCWLPAAAVSQVQLSEIPGNPAFQAHYRAFQAEDFKYAQHGRADGDAGQQRACAVIRIARLMPVSTHEHSGVEHQHQPVHRRLGSCNFFSYDLDRKAVAILESTRRLLRSLLTQ